MLARVMTAVLDGAVAIAFPLMLIACTVSVVIIIAGLRRRKDFLERQGRAVTPPRIELWQSPFAAAVLDVEAEATALLQLFESEAAQRFVTLELAVEPGLSVRTDQRALREILGDFITRAMEQSSCARILLGAAHIAGRVQITVSDDGVHADRALRASWLRSAQRLAALQGATMDIDARPGQGTTVTLRMPAEAARQPADAGSAALDPANVWSSEQRAHERSNAAR